jgi:hypothetical protein
MIAVGEINPPNLPAVDWPPPRGLPGDHYNGNTFAHYWFGKTVTADQA